ncbi:unnamed protein product, partial [Hapterophycus canaliculatus]
STHKNAGTPAYLLRQHLLGTLSDRLSTRPFLTDTEKRWLVYLLLRAAAQCHGKGVCHGDIKSENVLVTSGNWVLLTDFAPFKPTFLPDDHPADANYYFSSGEQGRCYLAPERFYSAPQAPEASVRSGGEGGDAADGADAGRSKSAGVGGPGGVRGRGGGGLDGLEASVIQPAPGDPDVDGSNTTLSGVAGGAAAERGKGSPRGKGRLDPQQTQQQQQQQQQQQKLRQGAGGGREDGSRRGSARAGGREGGSPGEGLLESMDVFSLGCVIAEVGLLG